MLRPLAHHVLDRLGCNRRQLQFTQHAVQGLVEITHGVHHGSVQVDDGGVHLGEQGGQRRRNGSGHEAGIQ